MDRSGPGRGQADADLARPLGVRAGHEGGLLLVPYLDEVELVPVAVEGADDRVDPVPGITVDPFDAVLGESFEQEVGCQLSHRTPIYQIALRSIWLPRRGCVKRIKEAAGQPARGGLASARLQGVAHFTVAGKRSPPAPAPRARVPTALDRNGDPAARRRGL